MYVTDSGYCKLPHMAPFPAHPEKRLLRQSNRMTFCVQPFRRRDPRALGYSVKVAETATEYIKASSGGGERKIRPRYPSSAASKPG